jgi:Cu/Ag efflux pump CusA
MKLMKDLSPITLIAILLANLTISLQSIAQVYKWVDENGKVHFSDKPFDEKSKAVKIKSQPQVSQQEVDQAKQRAARVIQQQRKINAINSEETREEQKAKAAREKDAAKTCAKAKREMQFMNGRYISYTTNDKGEKYALTDDEVNRLADELKAAIAKNCKK